MPSNFLEGWRRNMRKSGHPAQPTDDNMTAPIHRLSLTLLAVSLAVAIAPAGHAHEGHQDNMTDAEMLQAEMHGAEGMDSHSSVHAGADHSDGAMQAHHAAATASEEPPRAVALTPEQAMERAIADNRVTSASDLLGRLHPLAAHFPIALLLAAALAELLLIARPSAGLEVTSRFLVAGGAIGAVVAALLGWTAAGWRLADRSETLALHRWNGTAIAVLAVLASWLAYRTDRKAILRTVLAVLAVAIIAQGYLGGEMVFGPNHLGIR